MNIACIQPRIEDKPEKCYSEIEELVRTLLETFHDCKILCLPERWVPFFDDLPQNLQKERGDYYHFVKDLAKKHHIHIISGAIWEKREKFEKPLITSYFINNKGEEIGRQDKLHLYSYEKEYFEPGNELNLFPFDNHLFAILICFDMAFFETPRLAVEHGADILFSPTQIREDGMINWNIYLQARALENRIPVVACNSLGEVLDRKFQGNSKIISFVNGFVTPSKLKILEAPYGAKGYVFGRIDLDFPKKLREIRLNEKINKSLIRVNIVN
jgi:predicted amidohydrolase